MKYLSNRKLLVKLVPLILVTLIGFTGSLNYFKQLLFSSF